MFIGLYVWLNVSYRRWWQTPAGKTRQGMFSIPKMVRFVCVGGGHWLCVNHTWLSGRLDQPVRDVLGQKYYLLCPTGDRPWINLWVQTQGVQKITWTPYNTSRLSQTSSYFWAEPTQMNVKIYYRRQEDLCGRANVFQLGMASSVGVFSEVKMRFRCCVLLHPSGVQP